jgi:hypothetical protein
MEAITPTKIIDKLPTNTIDRFIKISIIHFSNEIRTRLTHDQFRKLVRQYRDNQDVVLEFEKLIHMTIDIELYQEHYEKFVRMYIENDIYYDLEFNYAIQPLLMFYTYLFTKNRIQLEPDMYVARLLKITQAYRYSKKIDPIKLTKFSKNTLFKR